MKQNELPYKTFQEKNNGLSAAQEVLYIRDFKKADKTFQKSRKS